MLVEAAGIQDTMRGQTRPWSLPRFGQRLTLAEVLIMRTSGEGVLQEEEKDSTVCCTVYRRLEGSWLG